MRYVKNEELKVMEGSDKKEWRHLLIREEYTGNGNVFYFPKLEESLMFQCLRCHSHYLHDECENWGGRAFVCGESGVRLGVFFCIRC